MPDDEIERLLREVEASLQRDPTAGADTSPEPSKRSDVGSSNGGAERPSRASRLRRATVLGAVAAGAMFVLFGITPFLGAVSGAVAAFVAVFLLVAVRG